MHPRLFFRPERCMLCLSCVLACELNSLAISDAREIPRGRRPLGRIAMTFSRGTPWPRKCQQCTTAPCVEACVTGSLVRQEGKAGILHRPETCVGCGSCLLVCPHGAPSYDEREERMFKCTLCSEEEAPACVRACQSRALVYREPNLFAWDKKKTFARELGRVHEGD